MPLMKGVTKAIRHVDLQSMGLSLDRNEIKTVDSARGAFFTHGCVFHGVPPLICASRTVDIHSLMGVEPSPSLPDSLGTCDAIFRSWYAPVSFLVLPHT
jgi:hypothetical protein